MFQSIKNALTNSLICIQMGLIHQNSWKPFLDQTKTPQKTQDSLLKALIYRNRNTRFGKEHGFSEINSIEQFQKGVPISRYEDLQSYIENPGIPPDSSLTSEPPTLYMQTSGTTDRPKNIPLIRSGLKELINSQAIFALAHKKGIPGVFKGKVLQISGSALEGHLKDGKPYGSMSGLIGDCMPYLLKSKYLIPPVVLKVEDYHLKYLLIAALALKERNITWMISANPTTFFKLIDVLEENLDKLIPLLETGRPTNLPEEFKKFNPGIFKATKDRIQELKCISRKSMLVFKRIWPNVRAVTTWTGGNCGLLVPKLKNFLDSQTALIELGYIASEFRGSLNIDVKKNICIPALTENYFEFIEPDQWDSGISTTKTLDQLERGKQYYVIATTQSGLYRYFINDIVEVTDFFQQTPAIRFIQKGKGIINLTGEKLTEFQVLRAMERVLGADNLTCDFFMMLADASSLQYSLYVESSPNTNLVQNIDRELSRLNLEFEAKQKSGRLHPTRVYFLRPGCGDAYKQHYLATGQRENQFKTVRLQNISDCDFDFQPYIFPSQ